MTTAQAFVAAIQSGHINGFYEYKDGAFAFSCTSTHACADCPVDLIDACHYYPVNHPLATSLQDQYPEFFL